MNDLAARLDRIKHLTDQYVAVKTQSMEARELFDRIRRELEEARAQLQPVPSRPPVRD